jgi:hypothetical protein
MYSDLLFREKSYAFNLTKYVWFGRLFGRILA